MELCWADLVTHALVVSLSLCMSAILKLALIRDRLLGKPTRYRTFPTRNRAIIELFLLKNI